MLSKIYATLRIFDDDDADDNINNDDDMLSCVMSAGQETAKQALQEIVILPALRPEVCSACRPVVTLTTRLQP